MKITMKTQISIIPILILFMSFSAQAQFELGVKQGVTISNATIEGIGSTFQPNKSAIIGYSIGMDAVINFDRYFSVVTGIGYEQRGFDARYAADLTILDIDIPVGATLKTRVHYIEVPLGLKVVLPLKESKLKPYLAGGVKFGYGHSGDTRLVANLLIDINVATQPINMQSSNVQRLDVSPFGAIGLEIPYKSGAFALEFAYEQAIQSFLKDTVIDVQFRHFAYSPSISYRYIFPSKRTDRV